MRPYMLGVGCLAFALVQAPWRVAAAEPPAANNKIDEILACGAITVDVTRLACFDAARKKLAEARQKNGIVIVDRDEIRESKRSLFGFAMPNLAVFGDKSEPLTSLEAKLAATQSAGGGALVFTLDNGSRWQQQDDITIGFSMKAGAAVVVRRGALGTYFLSVANHSGIRVERIN